MIAYIVRDNNDRRSTVRKLYPNPTEGLEDTRKS
jgi:hypothetical protein